MAALNDLPNHAAEKLRRILTDIQGDEDTSGFARAGGRSFRIPVQYPSPVPQWLAWVVLGMVLEVPRLGRHEKLAWEFLFRFKGVPMTLAYEKFGLRAYVDANAVDTEERAAALVDEFFGRLGAAVPIVEKHLLGSVVSEQLNGGCVTVANIYGRLRRAYDHFRRRSENPQLPQAVQPEDVIDVQAALDPTTWEPGSLIGPALSASFREWEFREAAEFDRAAAVSAYVSALEHLLVFAFAFSDLDPADGTLERFIGSTWREKVRAVVDLQDRDSKRCYDALGCLVEEIRHPAAHGGFDHDRSLIYFHLPGLGAVPVQMSKAGVPEHFLFSEDADTPPGFSPWEVLDAVDAWLRSGPLRLVHSFAESGLDMPFSPEFRADLRMAATDDDEFASFLDVYSRHVDDMMNMDW